MSWRPDKVGRLWSQRLGLFLVVRGELLRAETVDGDLLLTPTQEQAARLIEERARLHAETARLREEAARVLAESLAADERAARLRAEERIRELERRLAVRDSAR